MKLGILSDTHGLLRQEVLDHLQGCDAILHGGDINNQGILHTLGSIAPVYVVRGNNDKEWAESLPLLLDFDLAGKRIYMTHKRRDLPADHLSVPVFQACDPGRHIQHFFCAVILSRYDQTGQLLLSA